MAQRRQLADPVWSESATVCVACGYSLQGLASPGVCPECGAPYEQRQLVLEGVPKRSTGSSTLRRWSWVGLMVFAGIFSQTIGLWFMYKWSISLVALMVILAWLTVMLLTSRRERQGAERFVVTATGISRTSRQSDVESQHQDTIFVPWNGATDVELQRIGAVWRRLRVGRSEGGRLAVVIFDAGVRCSDTQASEVLEEIRKRIETARGHLR